MQSLDVLPYLIFCPVSLASRGSISRQRCFSRIHCDATILVSLLFMRVDPPEGSTAWVRRGQHFERLKNGAGLLGRGGFLSCVDANAKGKAWFILLFDRFLHQ